MSEQWSTIEVEASEKKPEVEIEIEGQEEVQAAPEIVTDETPDNGEEKELEGIETQGAQKRIRQLIKQRKERDTELNTLRNELSSLKDTVREKDTQLSSSLKTSIDSNESKLNSTLEIAKDVYKQAAESGDTDRMLAAQETISKTYADMSQVDNQKRAWEDYNNKVQASVQEIQQNPDVAQNYDPKAVEWASKNSWFGTDNIMTSAALMIDNELKEEAQRVFETMPQIIPATYNGNPTYVQFTLPLAIPLKAPGTSVLVAAETEASESEKVDTLKNE